MKKLVLTFDDGNDIRYTPLLLDLLKKEKAPASFFTVASQAALYPSCIRRMQEDGHTVALHSLAHRHAYLCTRSYMQKDFSESIHIMNALGCPVRYYRPPWGIHSRFTNECLRDWQLEEVLWDVMAGDWKASSTPRQIAGRILTQVFDGCIICLHDAGEKTGGVKGAPLRTIQALEQVIPILKQEGYEFITIDEHRNGGGKHGSDR